VSAQTRQKRWFQKAKARRKKRKGAVSAKMDHAISAIAPRDSGMHHSKGPSHMHNELSTANS
jgi:hypothetical protein